MKLKDVEDRASLRQFTARDQAEQLVETLFDQLPTGWGLILVTDKQQVHAAVPHPHEVDDDHEVDLNSTEGYLYLAMYVVSNTHLRNTIWRMFAAEGASLDG